MQRAGGQEGSVRARILLARAGRSLAAPPRLRRRSLTLPFGGCAGRKTGRESCPRGWRTSRAF